MHGIKNNKKILRIYEREGGRCSYCGRRYKIEDMTMDHLVPKSRGGVNLERNRLLCCKECNWLKGNFISVAEAEAHFKKIIEMLKRVEEIKAQIKGKKELRELLRQSINIKKMDENTNEKSAEVAEEVKADEGKTEEKAFDNAQEEVEEKDKIDLEEQEKKEEETSSDH